jgi:hypothetical protein
LAGKLQRGRNAVLGALLGMTCFEDSRQGVPARIDIVASDTAVVVGRSLSFSVVGFDQGGREVAVGAVVWSVSDSRLGTIGADAVFTAAGAGDGYVLAVHAAGERDSAFIHVAAPGEVRWRYTPGAGRVFDAIGGVALALDGTVYALEDVNPTVSGALSALVALDRRGVVRWRVELPGVIFNYPVVTPSGSIFVAGRVMYLVGPAGAIEWQRQTTYPLPDFASGAATDAALVAAVGFDAQVFDINPPALRWSAPPESTAAWIVPPTIDSNGRVFLKHTHDSLFVFRLADGALLKRIADPDTSVDPRVFGVGTVPVDGRFYLPTAGRLAAFDTSGTLLWLTKDTGTGVTEPAVSPNGDLYVQVRTDGLWALRQDGMEKWRLFEIQPRWTWLGGVALARNGIIYAAGADGFYSISTSGQTLWRFQADSAGVPQAFIGAPAIAPDGTVYSFTSTHLYAFWGAEPPEPNSPWPMWRHDAQRTGWARGGSVTPGSLFRRP